jgi:hypothetical protein
MKYKGKLYGKIGNKYFDTGKTSDDFDELSQKAIENYAPESNGSLIESINELEAQMLETLKWLSTGNQNCDNGMTDQEIEQYIKDTFEKLRNNPQFKP